MQSLEAIFSIIAVPVIVIVIALILDVGKVRAWFGRR